MTEQRDSAARHVTPWPNESTRRGRKARNSRRSLRAARLVPGACCVDKPTPAHARHFAPALTASASWSSISSRGRDDASPSSLVTLQRGTPRAIIVEVGALVLGVFSPAPQPREVSPAAPTPAARAAEAFCSLSRPLRRPSSLPPLARPSLGGGRPGSRQPARGGRAMQGGAERWAGSGGSRGSCRAWVLGRKEGRREGERDAPCARAKNKNGPTVLASGWDLGPHEGAARSRAAARASCRGSAGCRRRRGRPAVAERPRAGVGVRGSRA